MRKWIYILVSAILLFNTSIIQGTSSIHDSRIERLFEVKASNTSQEAAERNILFENYPWLANLVDQNNCGSAKIEVYQGGAFTYLLVTDDQRVVKLYNDQGQFYCQGGPGYDCVALYNLDGPTDSWDCPPAITDCNTVAIINQLKESGGANACYAVTRINQVDYNGKSYFRTHVGRTIASFIQDNPCGVRDNFGATYDCQGIKICDFAAPIPPPNFDPAICAALTNQPDRIVWEDEANTCRIGNPLTLPFIADIINNTGGEVCERVTNITQIVYEGFTFFRLNSETIISTVNCVALAPTDVILDCKGNRIGTVGGMNDCPPGSACAELAATTGNTIWSRETNSTQCTINISSKFCRTIGIYDENDNLLHTLDSGQVPAITIPFEEWQDPNPLTEGETRTYIFKEGIFELGRGTASCNNPNIEVTSRFNSGCSDAAGVLILTNTGCRDLNIFGTSGDLLSTIIPDESGNFGPEPKTLYILIAGTDTLGVLNVAGFSEIDIDTKGCDDSGNNNVAIFNDYPWLNDLVNANNCSTEEVSVYQQGIYFYLLVTDANGNSNLYNQDGQFYCQNAPNYDCVAAYNLTGNLIDSWICNPELNCPQVIVCGVDGNIYPTPCAAAEAGVEASTDLGPCQQNMDCNFNYEGIVTVSICGGQSNDPILHLEDGRYIAAAFSGNANFTGQAGDRLRVRMDIDIQENQGVNCSVPAIIGLIRCFEIIETVVCQEEDCSLTTLPSDIGPFTVIYSICEGDTLTVPNTTITQICNSPVGPAPPIGTPIPIDIIPQVITTTPRWESNGSNNFAEFRSTISFYPKETTEFIGHFPPITCGGPVVIGAPLHYLIIVNKGSNCQTAESPTFLIEACIGDIITIPSPVVPSAFSINACTGNRQFTGGTTAELVAPISPFEKDIQVRILQQGSFQIEAMGGNGNYNSSNEIISCPDLTYQFQVRLKPECSFACAAVFDPVCGVDGKTYGNACEALRAGVAVATQGECTSNNDDAIFIEFPWLRDLINPTSCNGESITVYQLGAFKYIYLEGVFDNTLFFQNGQTYCVDAPNYDCRSAYRLSEIVGRWTCDGSSNDCPDVEGAITHTGTIVENNCGIYIKTTDNQYFYANYSRYGIEFEEVVGTTIEFDFLASAAVDDFCLNRDFQARAVFGEITCLKVINEAPNCASYTGTIFFRNCDDNRQFYFIETEDGRIFDPYFTSDIIYEPLEGQKVNFDFTDADFSSPCSIAEKAINITCIEAAENPSNNGDCTQHNGTIFFENCDDGTEFFFARTATGRILDLYFAEGINFVKYPEQQINFDYIAADFNSPCSIADQAVIVTCIEETSNNSNPAIFDNFPWLSTLINPNNCEGRVTVYQSNSFQFVYIDTPKGNNLYFQDGTFYCQDSPSYDCRAAYKLTEVVDSWTCSNYQELINEKRSISTIEKIDLSLFPNPTTGQVTVQILPNVEQEQQLRVVDLFGRVLSQEIIEPNVRQVKVDLSSYKNGVYYLELRARGNRLLKKVVKQDLE